ncbi:hypothetical protein RRG08_012405 [Elysia crispata]|uniref:Uncharacterized protein n=1 Tax=Elysia crispata TaxID=231223 RepID=A0AAE0YKU9_9GAST|nr:hypothetical protein RRG08_012405 [Elysia crispata]
MVEATGTSCHGKDDEPSGALCELVMILIVGRKSYLSQPKEHACGGARRKIVSNLHLPSRFHYALTYWCSKLGGMASTKRFRATSEFELKNNYTEGIKVLTPYHVKDFTNLGVGAGYVKTFLLCPWFIGRYQGLRWLVVVLMKYPHDPGLAITVTFASASISFVSPELSGYLRSHFSMRPISSAEQLEL